MRVKTELYTLEKNSVVAQLSPEAPWYLLM